MKNIQLKRTITLFQLLFTALGFTPIVAQTGLPQAHEPCFEQGEVLRYLEFSLAHSGEHKQAFWVAYTLDSAELEMPMKRVNPFKSDPFVEGNKATLNDYSKSGYDRGHLSRAMYNKRNERAYRESYYLSNVSPQIGRGFNQTGGLWYKAEDIEVELAKKHKVIYAISGPVFIQNIDTIGKSEIPVPGSFYKVILYQDSNGYWQCIGFLFPHKENRETTPFEHIVPVRTLENLTQINFNCALPDSVQNRIESSAWRP